MQAKRFRIATKVFIIAVLASTGLLGAVHFFGLHIKVRLVVALEGVLTIEMVAFGNPGGVTICAFETVSHL